MANMRLRIMFTHHIGKVAAEPMRRLRLSDAANVIAFTLDRHQRNMPDCGRMHLPAAMSHFAFRQQMIDEYRINCLQEEFCGQIHHRTIFIVELAMPLCAIVIAAQELKEKILMRRDVTVEIHAHETRELQEPWIDVAPIAWIIGWHCRDDITTKPFRAALLRESVDHSSVHTRFDRAADKNHGRWHMRIASLLHERDCGQHWHRRLAHSRDMKGAAKHVKDADEIVDVIIKIEAALG